MGMIHNSNTRIVSKLPIYLPLFSLVILFSFILVLALVSNRASTQALDADINLKTSRSAVAIFADGTDLPGEYTMEVFASDSGNISSVVQNIRVVSSGVYGYNLMLQAKSGNANNMVGQTSSTNLLVPIGAPVQSPATFTTNGCNAWGFATPAVNGNYSFAFDSSYQTENSLAVSKSNSRYASVPTAATLIHQGNSNDETRPYYFAACVNSAAAIDIYKATVVWTATSLDGPVETSNVVVDIDDNMIPIRWNYDACTYGNGAGDVLDSAPTTNVAATDPLVTACWVKADPSIYSSNTNDDWYNYTTDATMTNDTHGQPYYINRKMANAVTFVDVNKLNQYKSAPVGAPILDTDIGAYWTYMPRYEYKIERYNYDSSNYPHAFDVRLTNKYMPSKKLKDIQVGWTDPADPTGVRADPARPQYLTPPAFTFGGKELNGIWFGKFEASNPNLPVVKPGVYPTIWRELSIMFQNGISFGNQGIAGNAISTAGGNRHNFSNLNRTNSHISKDSEWATIVYFAQSMYGICSNMNCTSDNSASNSMVTTVGTSDIGKMQRVRNNAMLRTVSNGIQYPVTGCGPNSLLPTDDTQTTSCSNYNTQLGVLASTTHNVYGLYDTAGGAWEYTTRNYATGGGSAVDSFTPTNSQANISNLNIMFGVDANIYHMYFDIYSAPPLTNNGSDIVNGKYGTGSSGLTYQNEYFNIYPGKLGLGQAIFETAGWASDAFGSVGSSLAWQIRGSHPGRAAMAGINAIAIESGVNSYLIAYRVSLLIFP